MHHLPYQFLPFPLIVYLVFAVVFLLVIALIEIGIIHYAADQLGLQRRTVFLLLLLCLAGSYVNIPLARISPEEVVSDEIVTVFGIPYVIPEVQQWPGTMLAINVGGAIIPAGLASYLLIKNKLYYQSILGIMVVSIIAYAYSQPVRGVGISIPIFIPPIAAVFAGIVFAPQRSAPLAYISGTLGTLIGADLFNLSSLHGLGAPVASIGGAGTFDGIFLTGLIAVLLA